MTVIDDFKLDNSVVLITGAASGIGEAIAEAISEAGGDLALVDIDDDGLERVKSNIMADTDSDVVTIRADVSQEAETEQMVNRTVDEFGQLDVGFANAGIAIEDQALSSYDMDEWNRLMGVNLRGVFLTNKECAKAMLNTGSEGSIINTASILGLIGTQLPGQAAYAASKGGVIQVTKQLAAELGPAGIRVNAIAPGWIRTNLAGGLKDTEGLGNTLEQVKRETCIQRLGEPEDIKGLATFLASDASAYCTGSTYVIDGGWLAF